MWSDQLEERQRGMATVNRATGRKVATKPEAIQYPMPSAVCLPDTGANSHHNMHVQQSHWYSYSDEQQIGPTRDCKILPVAE
ncbi:unnamed protein product [Protopolystoma xenopodis]|uniref:Uncharacterized protein n=1 Tax=Protopolystoma xenopodis TaxID=117903 RepID=A0A3S5FHA8_9PLAT|nr:unnamed protein product [Protopolystoma xenopodis]